MNSRTISVLLCTVAAFVFGGCSLGIPIVPLPAETAGLGLDASVALEPMFYSADLGSRISTVTPIGVWAFPAPEARPVSVEPNGCPLSDTPGESGMPFERMNLAPRVGLYGSYGSERLHYFAGLSARLNPLHFQDSPYSGLYAKQRHLDDHRSPEYAAYAFCHVAPGAMAIIPSTGVGGRWRRFVWGLEVGLPYQKWTVESGNEARIVSGAIEGPDGPEPIYGEGRAWVVQNRDTWRGFGVQYSAKLGCDVTEHLQATAQVHLEDYPWAKFMGQRARIWGIGAMVNLVWQW